MLICVTNRKLCQGDFLARIDQLAEAKPFAIMLREKDMELAEYEELALQVAAICRRYSVNLIIHQNSMVADRLRASYLHLPLPMLRSFPKEAGSHILGTSVHSVAEAKEAQELGANYVIAGHIYDTDSKQGLKGRGLGFLQQVCQAVSLPVFAIGGITGDKAGEVLRAGAKGYCAMSEAMQCDDPGDFVKRFRK